MGPYRVAPYSCLNRGIGMDFYTAYKTTEEWHRKADLVHLYHNMCRSGDSRWTLKNTAMYFGVSLALVSEDVKLSKAFNKWPELVKMETRQHALEEVKKREKND